MLSWKNMRVVSRQSTHPRQHPRMTRYFFQPAGPWSLNSPVKRVHGCKSTVALIERSVTIQKLGTPALHKGWGCWWHFQALGDDVDTAVPSWFHTSAIVRHKGECKYHTRCQIHSRLNWDRLTQSLQMTHILRLSVQQYVSLLFSFYILFFICEK